MTLEILTFAFGALLILVGILGGGFEAKEVKIPKVSGIIRVFTFALGIFFTGMGFVVVNDDKKPEPSTVSNSKKQITITIQDELAEYQIPQDYEGQTTVRINGRNFGTVTVNASFPKSSLVATLPSKGQYRYIIEAVSGWNENGNRVTAYCLGDGEIDADEGKKFIFEGRVDGDTCTAWLEEID